MSRSSAQNMVRSYSEAWFLQASSQRLECMRRVTWEMFSVSALFQLRALANKVTWGVACAVSFL